MAYKGVQNQVQYNLATWNNIDLELRAYESYLNTAKAGMYIRVYCSIGPQGYGVVSAYLTDGVDSFSNDTVVELTPLGVTDILKKCKSDLEKWLRQHGVKFNV